MRNQALMAVLLAICASCLVVKSEKPWAPLNLRLDETKYSPRNEAYVYVNGDYRGNFIDGKFRIFLTLEPHEVRVHADGCEEWKETVTLTRAEYPGGRVITVQPAYRD